MGSNIQPSGRTHQTQWSLYGHAGEDRGTLKVWCFQSTNNWSSCQIFFKMLSFLAWPSSDYIQTLGHSGFVNYGWRELLSSPVSTGGASNPHIAERDLPHRPSFCPWTRCYYCKPTVKTKMRKDDRKQIIKSKRKRQNNREGFHTYGRRTSRQNLFVR